MPHQLQPKVVIISGPSGTGKSTIVRRLLRECSVPLRLSVSATTRAKRPMEADGIDYHFLSREDFLQRRQQGLFLECMEVFGRGDWYGTLKTEVTSALAEASWPLLEIDVDGAMKVLPLYPQAITIFLHAGSLDELERRLRDRGTETEAAIQRRLEVARHELALKGRYMHEVVNHTIEQAVHDICRILVQSA